MIRFAQQFTTISDKCAAQGAQGLQNRTLFVPELENIRASYVVGLPHVHTTGALETLEIFWVTEREQFVYVKVTVSVKIMGFFLFTDQEHMDITKMAAT